MPLVPVAPRGEPSPADEAGVATAPPPRLPQPPQMLRPEEWNDAEREAVLAAPLQYSKVLANLPAKSDDPRPTFLSADRIRGVNDLESVAEGSVELRRIGTIVEAERLTYRHGDDEVEAEGKVRFVQEGGELSGPRLKVRIDEMLGTIDEPAYSLRREPRPGSRRHVTEAHGRATKIEFQGENRYRLEDATYSTCRPGDDSWFAKVSGLSLDFDREVGEGRDATVVFKGVPIFYTPWLSFSLNEQRKSGLLPPTFGSTSQSGLELTLPYYWNIAPNMDATIAPRVFGKRGVQINTEFRYLTRPYSGQAQVEWLPGDRVRNTDRWGYSLRHAHDFGNGLTASVNANGVSDDLYYKDLSSRIANSAQTQLLRQGTLSYAASWWSASALLTRYQTLQPDPATPVARPYEITPQVAFNARRTLFDVVDTAFLGQYTDFSHPDPAFLQAKRTVLYPQLTLPFVTPAFYVTPKLGVHLTRYRFDRALAGGETSYSRNVPIASVDAGLGFERDVSIYGSALRQTLEPRLYYLWVPNRDQSVLTANGPLVNGVRTGISFDTGINDFNFAQIFSENLFTGHDRIADANQVTAALTTRFLEPASGREVFKAMLGQRLYFDSQDVTLNPGDARRTAKKTDLLAAVSGQVAPYTHVEGAWQYNPRDGRTERLQIGGRYAPEPGRLLNVAYRTGRNQSAPFEINVKQVDVSGQWPLFGGWQAMGRYNYSLNEKRVIENIAGLEYVSACWSARVVVQRFATTATTSTSAVFVQLELADFSRIGSNPLELLKRSIPGYGRVDQPAGDPVFGTQ